MEKTIKPMINIMIYHTIANTDDSIKLTIMENDKGLYMPSIEFKEFDLAGEDIYYDNPAFIFGPFSEALQHYKSRDMNEEHSESLKDLLEIDIQEDTVLDIIEILEKGIELGWNKVD